MSAVLGFWNIPPSLHKQKLFFVCLFFAFFPLTKFGSLTSLSLLSPGNWASMLSGLSRGTGS